MDRKKLFFSNADLRKLILPLVVDQFLQAVPSGFRGTC